MLGAERPRATAILGDRAPHGGRFQNRTPALRGSMDDSLTEHRAILAAIRLRDADRAAALTAAHIRVPAQRLQAALREDDPEQAPEPGSAEPARLSRA